MVSEERSTPDYLVESPDIWPDDLLEGLAKFDKRWAAGDVAAIAEGLAPDFKFNVRRRLGDAGSIGRDAYVESHTEAIRTFPSLRSTPVSVITPNILTTMNVYADASGNEMRSFVILALDAIGRVVESTVLDDDADVDVDVLHAEMRRLAAQHPLA